jgi:hypothetical protein
LQAKGIAYERAPLEGQSAEVCLRHIATVVGIVRSGPLLRVNLPRRMVEALPDAAAVNVATRMEDGLVAAKRALDAVVAV